MKEPKDKTIQGARSGSLGVGEIVWIDLRDCSLLQQSDSVKSMGQGALKPGRHGCHGQLIHHSPSRQEVEGSGDTDPPPPRTVCSVSALPFTSVIQGDHDRPLCFL